MAILLGKLIVNGTELSYKEWSSGQPVVFSHGWHRCSDAFEEEMQLQPPQRGVLKGVRDKFWRQIILASLPALYFCIKAFSETDFTNDLRKIDVPTLILHGGDDQIVPIEDSSKRSAKLIKNSTLKIYPCDPHGICTTLKQEVNEDILAFIRG